MNACHLCRVHVLFAATFTILYVILSMFLTVLDQMSSHGRRRWFPPPMKTFKLFGSKRTGCAFDFSLLFSLSFSLPLVFKGLSLLVFAKLRSHLLGLQKTCPFLGISFCVHLVYFSCVFHSSNCFCS